MDKTTFTIVYWIGAVILIGVVYVLFVKFRDYVINYGKTTARKYMEKMDPNLEEQSDLDELEGLNDLDDTKKGK